MTKKPSPASKPATRPRARPKGRSSARAAPASEETAPRRDRKGRFKGKGPGGRPKIKLNVVDAEKLATLQCTFEEIAAFFDVSVDTVRARSRDDREFSQALQKGREGGRISVRREQFRKAVDQGNVTMLIWLGKQWLGQRDRQDLVTVNQVEEFSDAYIEAGRNLVENVAAGASPKEVLRMFEAEVRAIAGTPGKANGGLPN